jgi:hypothetical protein
MARKFLKIGDATNSGDTLRDASRKINDNFAELFGHAEDENNPHRVTAAQVGAIPQTLIGTANGVASLDENGRLRASQKPVYRWQEIADRPVGVQDRASSTVVTLSDDRVSVNGSLTIDGDLNVRGTLRTVQRAQIDLGEAFIQLHSGTDTPCVSDAGMKIVRGTGSIASLVWDASTERWSFKGGSVADIENLTARSFEASEARLSRVAAETAELVELRAERIAGQLDGVASSASRLEHPVAITLTGAVTGKGTFDGADDVKIETSMGAIRLGEDTIGSYVGDITTAGGGLSVSSSGPNGGTIMLSLTPDVVLRDQDGTVRGPFVGDLEGTAETSQRWRTPRAFQLQGDILGSAIIDGSSNVTLQTSFSSDAVAPYARRLEAPKRIRLRGAVEGEATFDGSDDVTMATTMMVKPKDIGALPASGGVLTGIIQHTIAENVEATGNNQDFAQPLSASVNIVSVASASDCAVRLPRSIPGAFMVVINDAQTDINVFPASGERIDFSSTDVPILLSRGSTLTVVGTSQGRWFSL